MKTAPSLMDFMILARSKPALGAPCNGCGQCCLASRCATSEDLFGESDEICPALEWDQAGSLYRCRLIRTDFAEVGAPKSDARANAIFGVGGVNRGCGCDDDVANDLVELIEAGKR